MNSTRLLFSNLLFYWRTNLAVLLGVAAATAVIGGALVVGDSVRESLKQMSLDRLGKIDHLLTGPRFFTEELANSLGDDGKNVTFAPAIVMQGTVEYGETRESAVRAGHIQVYGVDERSWDLLEHGSINAPQSGEIVLNERVASQLNLEVGKTITLIVEIPASIPRDALLGDREETVTAIDLTVSGIATEDSGLGRLGFNPTQQIPLNVFMSLDELQRQTGLAEVKRSKREPIPKPARVNTLLIASPNDITPKQAENLTEQVQDAVTLEDLALKLVTHPDYRYVSLESEQMILENGLANVALEAANAENISTSPVLVYLLNELRKHDPAGDAAKKLADPNYEPPFSMYSVIAGVDLESLPSFDYRSSAVAHSLQGDEVIVNTWLANDLDLGVGDTLEVKYHVVGDRGQLPEESHQFEVVAITELIAPTDDPGFTPTVPGVTDAESYDDWREPFPLKRELIPDRDDEYWDKFRTVPKVYVSIEKAQELWRSRYGELTSLRMTPGNTETLDELSHRYRSTFIKKLGPEVTGLVVQPVKSQGLQAAQGTTDFTGLFIGFSFFLILAATLLVGLLFLLGIEQRSSELGLLQAIGMTPRSVRGLYLWEGLILVVLGAGAGTLLAVAYAAFMMYGLRTWWIGAIGTKFLTLSVQPVSLVVGAVISIVVAGIVVVWALRRTQHFSAKQLLQGRMSDDSLSGRKPLGPIGRLLGTLPIVLALTLAAITLLGLVPKQEAFGGFSWRIVAFFLVGTFMLWGGLSSLSLLLQSEFFGGVVGRGWYAETMLALRNASRNRRRSVLSTNLLAMAAFVIMAVAAGQQNPTQQRPEPRSGNGGFTLVAESNLPILYDLNTDEGRAKVGLSSQDPDVAQLLQDVWIAPFRMRAGENASCLNLYQTQLPTVLGVPNDVLDKLIEEQRFTFADTPSDTPWELLREELPEGRIPVLGDMNTLMYSMHVGIGGTVDVPLMEDTAGGTLEIKGMFANSVFQGVLVMSEENFLKLFPKRAGFRYFLIDCKPENSQAVATLLEQHLGDSGFDTEPVADRLADFLAVQNTYLSTFQTLGGLGLLLGTFGLATVMLRNVLERRGELALLRAVGLRPASVGRIVLWEHALLLLWGLATGSIAALVAMGPHLLSSGADVPWTSLWVLMALVIFFGMLTALFAVRAAVRIPILSTLRGE